MLTEDQRYRVAKAGKQCERALVQRAAARRRCDLISEEFAARCAAMWSAIAFHWAQPR